MKKFTEDLNLNIDRVSTNIVNWFKENARELPWRETENPYYILISEIMLQQTQVSTVIPYYLRFIETLPTLEKLSQATEEQLHFLWQGLGYYSRVYRLQQFALIIVNEHQGIIPDNKEQLIKLPGIGPYTCGALLSFAFHQKEPAVDGNVKRVIARLLCDDRDMMKQATITDLTYVVRMLIPEDPYSFNQGLIELGALICKPLNPECGKCPIKNDCLAYRNEETERIPVKKKKQKQKVYNLPVLIIEEEGEILFVKRKTSGLLSNLWGLPALETDASRNMKVDGHEPRVNSTQNEMEEFHKSVEFDLKEYINIELGIFIKEKICYIGHVKHVFSHVIWEQYIYCIKVKGYKKRLKDVESPKIRWATEESISIPTAFKKTLKVYNNACV